MPSSKHREPLRPGQDVWLWYAGVVCRATVRRRGLGGETGWRVTVHPSGDGLHVRRRRVFLCREDALNYAGT